MYLEEINKGISGIFMWSSEHADLTPLRSPWVDFVKLNVVTVKGSHRALLWVFSVSGKYNRILPRYPDHRCPAAACTNTSKAIRNCNGDARETFGIDSS